VGGKNVKETVSQDFCFFIKQLCPVLLEVILLSTIFGAVIQLENPHMQQNVAQKMVI